MPPSISVMGRSSCPPASALISLRFDGSSPWRPPSGLCPAPPRSTCGLSPRSADRSSCPLSQHQRCARPTRGHVLDFLCRRREVNTVFQEPQVHGLRRSSWNGELHCKLAVLCISVGNDVRGNFLRNSGISVPSFLPLFQCNHEGRRKKAISARAREKPADICVDKVRAFLIIQVIGSRVTVT